MTEFRIMAYAPDGRRVVQRLEAADAAAAQCRARDLGLSPYRISAATGAGAERSLAPKARLALLGELAALTTAHVPLAEALATIASAARTRDLAAAARAAADGVIRGEPLARVLATPPIGLPAAIAGAIRAGEMQGDLGAALTRATASLTRSAALIRRVRGALTYPAILLGVTVLSVSGILLGVVPALAPVFLAAGDAAPASARVLVLLSEGLQALWQPLLAGMLIAALGAARGLRHPDLRGRVEAAALRLPLLGAILRGAETATALRAVSDLIAAGTPLPEALGFAAGAARSAPVRAALEAVARAVREGADFPAAFAAEPVFAPGTAGLIAAGGRSGRLAALMLIAAEALEREVEARTETLLAIVPPAMTLILGGVVGGVSITILGAIMSVNDAAL